MANGERRYQQAEAEQPADDGRDRAAEVQMGVLQLLLDDQVELLEHLDLFLLGGHIGVGLEVVRRHLILECLSHGRELVDPVKVHDYEKYGTRRFRSKK